MGFPIVAATNSGGNNTATTTSHVVPLPASISAGDLLIIALCISTGSPAVATPAGWTSLLAASNGANAQNLAIFYKIASGTEGASVTVTTAAGKGNYASHRIANGSFDPTVPPSVNTPAYATGVGSSTPNAKTVAWGAAANLWIAYSTASISLLTYPPTFTTNQFVATVGSGIGTGTVATATISDAVATETPGAFTYSGSGGVGAYMLAVKPAKSPGLLQFF